MTDIAKEYGAALFALSLEENKKSEYRDCIETLRSVFLENPEYIDFLSSPAIPLSERLEAVLEAFSGTLVEGLVSYLLLLVQKGRIGVLFDSLDEFFSLYDKSEKVLKAKVVSAVSLTDEEKERLKQKLEKTYLCKILAEFEISPLVLGGLVVELDGTVLDGSIKKGLSEVKEVMNS